MERISTWWRGQRESLRLATQALRAWTPRQVLAAIVAGLAVAAVIGLATVLIPNPIFARDIPTVPWNYPVWIATSALMGILIATYVQPPPMPVRDEPTARTESGAASDQPGGTVAGDQPGGLGARDQLEAATDGSERRSARVGGAAGILAWFAVGCPVCNKIALIALGYTGALTWFAPLQPFLAAIALVLLLFAVIWRLRGQVACPLPAAPRQVVSAS